MKPKNPHENKLTNLTQERLKESLSYNPDSGIFVWLDRVDRIHPNSRKCIGKIAGSNSNGYKIIKIDGSFYMAHRLAWLYIHGTWPTNDLDHKDLNRSNNRIDNLRDSTIAENSQNCPITKRNTTGYKGVTFNRDLRKFKGTIQVNKKQIHLGYFDTAESAYSAYCEASKKYHGEFGRT